MQTFSKVVQGQMPNTGDPHDWWNDTQINVNKGDTLKFSATGRINPGFGPGFGPAGQVGHMTNKHWDESLAYRAGGTRCWFCALIGKIGRDGKAFCIGASGTIAAPAGGRLYLAVNDGVNFQDNSGQCKVSVTVSPKRQPISQEVYFFFGGSDGQDPSKPGPDPKLQTPSWIEGMVAFPYIGTKDGVTAKQGQGNQAVNAAKSDYADHFITAIGYSAGADSALIFADSFRKNNTGAGKITGLALLEGTMSGGMSGGLRLENEWEEILNQLLKDGVNIYVLNDKGNDSDQWKLVKSYTPPQDATGIYCCDFRPNQEHWDGGLTGQFGIGTNNSKEYRDFVMGWLKSPTPCTCDE